MSFIDDNDFIVDEEMDVSTHDVTSDEEEEAPTEEETEVDEEETEVDEEETEVDEEETEVEEEETEVDEEETEVEEEGEDTVNAFEGGLSAAGPGEEDEEAEGGGGGEASGPPGVSVRGDAAGLAERRGESAEAELRVPARVAEPNKESGDAAGPRRNPPGAAVQGESAARGSVVPHAARFLDFATRAAVSGEKRWRRSAAEEEDAARAVLAKFELAFPTTRLDRQLMGILGKITGATSHD